MCRLSLIYDTSWTPLDISTPINPDPSTPAPVSTPSSIPKRPTLYISLWLLHPCHTATVMFSS